MDDAPCPSRTYTSAWTRAHPAAVLLVGVAIATLGASGNAQAQGDGPVRAPAPAEPPQAPRADASPATAPEPTAPDATTAEVVPSEGSLGALSASQTQMVEEGIALREASKDKAALERFERAYVLGHDARILAQIAFAEQALGRWVASVRHLREALADASHPWIAKNRQVLESELKKMMGRIGHLEVRVNVEGAVVFVEGQRVGTTPLADPIIAAPGVVHVVAEKAGFLRAMRQVTIMPNGLARVEVKLLPQAAGAAPRPTGTTPDATEREDQRNPLWLIGAGAGALIAAGAVVPWLMADGELSDQQARCEPTCMGTYDEGADSKIRRLDNVTTAMLAGGLGVAAVSVALYFLLPKERASTPTVASLVGRDGGRMTTQWRF